MGRDPYLRLPRRRHQRNHGRARSRVRAHAVHEARTSLQRILRSLEAEIRAGVPIVGLEPSCASVFRDELVNLFPSSDDAGRLSKQIFTFAEWLDKHHERLGPVRLERRAIVHGHCHHKAIMHTDADHRVIERLGLRAELLDSGCCGMAGAFGFEASHYDVSMAIGERVLLPAVRGAARDPRVIADGFSCREQIAQSTDRLTLHLADVVRLAMREGPRGPAGDLPEQRQTIDYGHDRIAGRELAAAGLTAVGALLAIAGARRLALRGES